MGDGGLRSGTAWCAQRPFLEPLIHARVSATLNFAYFQKAIAFRTPHFLKVDRLTRFLSKTTLPKLSVLIFRKVVFVMNGFYENDRAHSATAFLKISTLNFEKSLSLLLKKRIFFQKHFFFNEHAHFHKIHF